MERKVNGRWFWGWEDVGGEAGEEGVENDDLQDEYRGFWKDEVDIVHCLIIQGRRRGQDRLVVYNFALD